MPLPSSSQYFRLFFLICIAGLSACATAPKTSQPLPEGKPLFWKAEGKIGIRTQNKAQSANFVWENLDQDYHIQLFGPFGQGRVHIKKEGNEVQLLHKNTTRIADNAQQLLEQETGIVMPVHWLSAWILGDIANDVETEHPAKNQLMDDQQRLIQFQQGEWQVEYVKFQSPEAHSLPTKIKLKHQNYQLTIIVKSWQI